MKKTIMTIILTVMATMTVMAAFGIGMIEDLRSEYETKLTEVTETYESNISYIEVNKDQRYAEMKRSRDEYYNEYNELNEKYVELAKQVYNMFEGEDYDIRFNHDGEFYSYTLVHDQNGIGKLLGFATASRTVID